MKNETKIAIGLLSAIAVGTALYFLVFKKKSKPTTETNQKHGTGLLPEQDNPKIDFIKSVLGSGIDTPQGLLYFENELINMSKQELNDVYDLAVSLQNNTEIKDDAQKARLDAISKKYNIFT
jgi:hypothetical protein